MKAYFKILLSTLGFIFTIGTNAQEYKQSIFGNIVDEITLLPVSEVHLELWKDNESVAKTTSNAIGAFEFQNVEVGNYEISFSHISYKSFTKPLIAVQSSRGTFLEIELEKLNVELDEVVISPYKSRNYALNEMSQVSSISISATETRKLAGGLDDPIRTAANFAGIFSNGSFSDNFVSIRGNSGRSLKYQLEGLPLPNPTHFSRIGSSGGTFTIFSIQMLDNSDFYIGAFPAEYSNALGGVLDVNFRKGNNKQNEFSLAAGTLGLDFSAEGPLNKTKGSSYLMNFRYATIGLARLIGYPTQPIYSDLSFNFNFPLSQKSNLKLFGILGASDRLREAEMDSTIWEESLDRYELALNSKMATLGFAYNRLLPNEKTLLKISALLAATAETDNQNYLDDNLVFKSLKVNEYNSLPASVSLSFNSRFNDKHINKTGFQTNYRFNNYHLEEHSLTNNQTISQYFIEGNYWNTNVYSQSKFQLNRLLSAVLGVNVSLFNVNVGELRRSVEPRLSLEYILNKTSNISIAYGKHSQAEEFAVYNIYESTAQDRFYPNEDLDLVASNHFIASFKSNFSKNHSLTIEGYYQFINKLPVALDNTFSTANLEELVDIQALTNNGSGKNYGIDVSFERFSKRQLYYMINASWLRSKYFDFEGIERSTQFDYGYNINFLMGKEYLVGEQKNKRNFFAWNTTLSAIGGRPFTPVDLEASSKSRTTVLIDGLAFTERDEPLIVLDFTTSFKTNKDKRNTEWALQIKNIFSSADALIREYDEITGEVETVASSGFFPALSWKMDF